MKTIGITGGIGAGKSVVLKLLENQFRAQVIQTDQLAKDLQRIGECGYNALVDYFGTDILDEYQNIDVQRFGEVIFKNPTDLKKVNEIIHPLTWQRVKDLIQSSNQSLIVVESALFDKQSKSICDELWMVDATRENRENRLMVHRGYSMDKIHRIMELQNNREYYLELVDFVLDNNADEDQLLAQIKSRLNYEDRR